MSKNYGVKDHIIREVVNNLRDVALQYHDTQQLRERIRDALEPLLLDLEAVHKKAAQWDYEQYWTTGGRGNHAAG